MHPGSRFESPIPRPPDVASGGDDFRTFLRPAILFTAVGFLLYLGLYVGSEAIAREHAERNRFHVVHSAPHDHYDAVILGASRSAVFDYRDMNSRLETLAGASVMNLSTVGGGVLPNRVLLDYFLSSRTTDQVIYFVDSFAFYSEDWNEERLRDTSLFRKAPLDPSLARLLLGRPETRLSGLEYLTGFHKVNNPERFEPDLFQAEGAAFERIYRPVPQIDRQRIAFLYPDDVASASPVLERYLGELEEMMRMVAERGMSFVIVRAPLPERFLEMLEGEEDFSMRLQEVADRNGVAVHDFTRTSNDPDYFYDSDHLNETGVTVFFQEYFGDVIAAGGEAR